MIDDHMVRRVDVKGPLLRGSPDQCGCTAGGEMALGAAAQTAYLIQAMTVMLFIACAVVSNPAYSIYIAPPRVTVLPSSARLHALCGPDTCACTFIRGVHFGAACDRDSAGWRARIDISLVPYTFVEGTPGRQPHELAHEIDHLRDIQQDLLRYARPLASQRFASEDACTTVMSRRAGEFYDRVRQFAGRSQRARQ